MKFKLNKKTSAIKSFVLHENNLITLDTSNELFGIDVKSGYKYDSKKVGKLQLAGDFLFHSSWEGYTESVYDLSTNQLVFDSNDYESKITFKPNLTLGKQLFGRSRDKDGFSSNEVFDSVNRKFVSTGNRLRASDSNSILLSWNGHEETLIEAFDKSLNKVWEYTFNEIMIDQRGKEQAVQINQIIGSIDSLLWISKTSGEIIALHKSTGHLKYKIDKSKTSLETNNIASSFRGHTMQFSKNKDKLIGLRRTNYFEIDLTKDTIKRQVFDFSRVFEKANIESQFRDLEFPISDKNIFFCDDSKGKIGLFDYVNRELVCTYQFETDNEVISQINKLDFHNDKYYVLTRNNELYEFSIE